MSWNSGFQLRVVEGRQKGLVVTLAEHTYVIGRAAQMGESAPEHIFFLEPTVSRTHAELKWNEKRKLYSIQHRSNTNPTLVEGTPVGKKESRNLVSGNEIRMGLLVLAFEAVGSVGSKATESNLGSINSAMGGSREGRLGDKVREPEKPPSLVVGNILEALNNLTEQKTRETSKVNRDDVRQAQHMHTLDSRPAESGRGGMPTMSPTTSVSLGGGISGLGGGHRSGFAAPAPDEDNYLERGFDNPEDAPLGFKVVVGQGPDAGQSFSVTDHLTVIGRSSGREDRRHGMGVLLTDETLPTEAAMLVWQSREGSYGLLEAEHNTASISVRRVVSGKPVEYGVQPNRPLILQEGDVILVGRTALVLRRTETAGSKGREPKKVESGPPRMPLTTRPGASDQGHDFFRPSRAAEAKGLDTVAPIPPMGGGRRVTLGDFSAGAADEPPARSKDFSLPVAPKEPPREVPPPKVPPPKVPPRETPPREVPPREVPPREMPPHEVPKGPVEKTSEVASPAVAAAVPELMRPQSGPAGFFGRSQASPPRGNPPARPLPEVAEAPSSKLETPAVSRLPSVFERSKRPTGGNLDPSEIPTSCVIRGDLAAVPTLIGHHVRPGDSPPQRKMEPADPGARPGSGPPRAPAPPSAPAAPPSAPAAASSITPPTAPVAPTSGAASRATEAIPVLSWPWKNSSDFVFDFLGGPNKGCQIALMGSELSDDRTITMGTATDKNYDVQLESSGSAPLVAVLRFRSGRFGLLNDGTDDSVSVNRFPLKRGDQVVLMTGDRIDIGDTVFRFLERRVVEFLQSYQVVVDSGVEQDQDKTFPFFKQRLLIGRGKNCDIRLNDLEVSRIHIAIVHRDGKFFIQHRSETNPTFLNGVSLLQGGERLIQPGDRVRLSSLTLLQFGRAEPKRKPMTPGASRSS